MEDIGYKGYNIEIFFLLNRHQQKSVDGYNRLPDVFTKEDVDRCFGYKNEDSGYMKIKRLQESGMVAFLEEVMQNGRMRRRYRKVNKMVV